MGEGVGTVVRRLPQQRILGVSLTGAHLGAILLPQLFHLFSFFYRTPTLLYSTVIKGHNVARDGLGDASTERQENSRFASREPRAGG